MLRILAILTCISLTATDPGQPITMTQHSNISHTHSLGLAENMEAGQRRTVFEGDILLKVDVTI